MVCQRLKYGSFPTKHGCKGTLKLSLRHVFVLRLDDELPPDKRHAYGAVLVHAHHVGHIPRDEHGKTSTDLLHGPMHGHEPYYTSV